MAKPFLEFPILFDYEFQAGGALLVLGWEAAWEHQVLRTRV